MANRKTYLYGLGTGLVAGALLLQLGTIGQSGREGRPEAGPSASETITIDQLEEAAEANGYVLHDANETWLTGAEAEAKVTEAEERVGAEAGTSVIYGFTVAAGSELTTIAKLVYELGLVKDYNEFVNTMKERGLAGKVQAKHFRFDGVPTLDELIEALITP
jgi:hypothetical protein